MTKTGTPERMQEGFSRSVAWALDLACELYDAGHKDKADEVTELVRRLEKIEKEVLPG